VVNKIRLRQVEHALLREYETLLDLNDVASASEEQRNKVFRTRALAAEAVRISARVTHADAAASVTDGSGDNGIDALYVDERNSRIFLVQSKWHSSDGTIGIGEAHAFRQGFKDLTDENYDRFNLKIQAMREQVSAALNDSELVLEMIVVTTGNSQISKEVQRVFDDLLEEINQDEEMLALTIWGLDELRAQLVIETGGARVDLMGVGIENYGLVTEPYLAYYGVVDGSTLKDWHDRHGDILFSKNIRKALGSTVVNDSLAETIVEAPEKFWYYNNGVTILCESISKRAKGASTRNYGEFDLRGASVVNGAQTVASIASALTQAPENTPIIPKVWVRAISLEGCPPGFEADVTRATNTQNSVESRDFVSLDDEQLRLRTDFRLSLGKNYAIKRGEKDPLQDDGCSVTDAAVALACMQPDVSLAVIAKSTPGRLWDMQGKYYRHLFNPQTNAYTVWRAVCTMRQVESVLRELRFRAPEGRPRALIVQGNRVVLWGVFKRLNLSRISDPDLDWNETKEAINKATIDVHNKLGMEVERLFPYNYITSLFKNSTRCRELAAHLLAEGH